MSKSKYLNETGLSQLVTLMQEDTDNRIELALENVVHAGNNPEDSGEILLVNADTLDGHTADYFATAESVDELRAEVESGSGNQVPEGVTYVDGTESEDAELLLVDADTLGGNAADYYASKTYVAEQVADANHLTREIVTEIPTVDTAKDNVIYMYKVESATGNDVYQEYQLINGEVVMVGDTSVDLSGYVKNETVENIVNGATVVAEATKSTFDGEGNKISETYATQENVDKIQTMSSEYIGVSGWYRVAEYKGINLDDIKGMHGNSCSLMIKRDFVNHSTEVHRLQLTSTYNYQNFVSTSSCAPNQVITKARYTYDATKFIAYIELYYNADYSNACYFEITHPNDCHRYWKAITPTLTEETVDGVTVTTTYDIPANAKPVTTAGVTVDTAIDIRTAKAIQNSPFIIHGISGGNNIASIIYKIDDVTQGYIGCDINNNPIFMSGATNGIKTLLHTGNKPSGTYTGNGDATERTISISCDSTIRTILVTGYGYTVYVSNTGAIGVNSNGTSITIPQSEARFNEGVLYLNTTNSAVNAASAKYIYEAL